MNNLTFPTTTIPTSGIPTENITIIRALSGDDIAIILLAWVGLWIWVWKGNLNDRQKKALTYFNMIGFPLIIGIYVLWSIMKVKTFG